MRAMIAVISGILAFITEALDAVVCFKALRKTNDKKSSQLILV